MTPTRQTPTQKEDDRSFPASRIDQRIRELMEPHVVRLQSLEKNQEGDRATLSRVEERTLQLLFEVKETAKDIQELKTDQVVTRGEVKSIEGGLALVQVQLKAQDEVLKKIGNSGDETAKSLQAIQVSQATIARQRDRIFPVWVTIIGGIASLVIGYFFALLTAHH